MQAMMILMIFIWDSDWGLIGLLPSAQFFWVSPTKCLAFPDDFLKSKGQTGNLWRPLFPLCCLEYNTGEECYVWVLMFQADVLNPSIWREVSFPSLSIHEMITWGAFPHTTHSILPWLWMSHLIFECQIIHFHFQTNMYLIFARF